MAELITHLHADSVIEEGVVDMRQGPEPDCRWISVLLADNELTVFGTVAQLRELAHVITAAAIRQAIFAEALDASNGLRVVVNESGDL